MPAPADAHERFMRLFLEHEHAILRSILMYVPHESDARDVLQETAVALWKRFADYDSSRPFVNWACGFARMEVRRFHGRAKVRGLLSEPAIAALMDSPTPPEAESAQRETFLWECYHLLPGEQRQLLDGYYFEDRSVNALAATHGRSVEAIYKMLQRTRRALFDCVTRKFAEARP